MKKIRPSIIRRKRRKKELKGNTAKLKYFSHDTSGNSEPNDKDFILG